MKIRNKLVSNSSSSSFVVFGYSVNSSAKKIYEEATGEKLSKPNRYKDTAKYKLQEILKNFTNEDSISVRELRGDYNETLIGIEPLGTIYDYSSKHLSDIDLNKINRTLDLIAEKLKLDKKQKQIIAISDYEY